MVTQRRVLLFALIALPFAIAVGCDKVPLLAPTGAVISLLPQTTTVSLNSEITIIATVIENGQSSSTTGTGSGATTSTSRSGAGTPVQNGTLVSFTTTLGRIEPSEARTHNGQVSVRLISGGSSGTATVTAFSGGASASTQLKIGTAAAGRITVTTTPQALGANGGNVTVTATVTDDGGGALGGVPVTFSTDKGSITPSTATTDSNGVATATLTTTATAKITATAGAQSGTATVNVNARSLASFTATPTSTTAGAPLTFSVTPTAGANISNVRVDFGDGEQRNLGAITGATTFPKTYSSSGTFTATATATDASGDAGALQTTVIISSLAVGLTAAPNPTFVGVPTTFSASVPAGTAVDHYVFTFSDRSPVTTTNPSTNVTFTSRGLKTVRVDVFGVGGGQIGSNSLTIDVQ
jgi:Bacterial Ig-like domain (group 1)/PKD domain